MRQIEKSRWTFFGFLPLDCFILSFSRPHRRIPRKKVPGPAIPKRVEGEHANLLRASVRDRLRLFSCHRPEACRLRMDFLIRRAGRRILASKNHSPSGMSSPPDRSPPAGGDNVNGCPENDRAVCRREPSESPFRLLEEQIKLSLIEPVGEGPSLDFGEDP